MLGILNFGHCDLFDICVLLFEIFFTETRNLLFLTTCCQKNVPKGLSHKGFNIPFFCGFVS